MSFRTFDTYVMGTARNRNCGQRDSPYTASAAETSDCRYLRAFINAAAQNFPGSIDKEEQKVLDEFDDWTANERLIVRLNLEHGDMLFLNNYTNLHSRTEFLDFEEPTLQRLLLRLWLKVPGFRNVHPDVAAQMNRFSAAPQRPASTTNEV